MQAGIHRLRTTVHLIRMIDDTLTYIPPRCAIGLGYSDGRSLMSSQLLKFLRSKQQAKFKYRRDNILGGAGGVMESKILYLYCI